MIKDRKYKPKFFPFSPGIPWRIERGKYIIPKLDFQTWHRVLSGRDLIITVFGGVFESFMSLSAAEAIKSFDPLHKMFWIGNQEYSLLANMNGLCKPSDVDINENILNNYPVPIFFDKNDNVYFNVLNNYLTRASYWGKYKEEINLPACKQIAYNITVPWRNYIPKLRKAGSEFINEMFSTGRIRSRSKIAVIILDSEVERYPDTLCWNVHNIKEFAQLASYKGIKVVVFSKNTDVFYGTNMLVYKYDLRKVIQAINKAWLVMSDNAGWVLISMMLSDSNIIAKNSEGPFNLFDNAEFLGVSNEIIADIHWVSPIDALTICEDWL